MFDPYPAKHHGAARKGDAMNGNEAMLAREDAAGIS
jgi:hypothetical protein